MKTIRTLDELIYGDYPALYALGIQTPVRAPRARVRKRVLVVGAVIAALLAAGVTAAVLI
jgi:hypothetical protein